MIPVHKKVVSEKKVCVSPKNAISIHRTFPTEPPLPLVLERDGVVYGWPLGLFDRSARLLLGGYVI